MPVVREDHGLRDPRRRPRTYEGKEAMTDELPGVGQIWLARVDRGPDLYALVIEVHQGHVQALLCGDECHRATNTDPVLEPRVSGCPRRLLVHGDLAGAILDDRLTPLMGSVTPELVQRIVLRAGDWTFTPATWVGEGQSVTTTTPAGTGSSSRSGNSAAFARAPASSDGRCTSSATRPPKGRPRSL
jgi:hypothetical protein